MTSLFSSIMVGFLAGITSGLLGIGGGVIFVPALVVFLRFGIHEAIGTSLAVIIPTACAGLLKHYSGGNVDLRYAVLLSVFAVTGGYLGAGIAIWLPGQTLKRVFGVFLIGMGVYFLSGSGMDKVHREDQHPGKIGKEQLEEQRS